MRGVPRLDHLRTLVDDVGIIQHAVHDVPNRSTGYCTDDVSRAFMVAVMASAHEPLRDGAIELGRKQLAFLMDAQTPTGAFRNFMSYERAWLDEAGTEDSNGRALWSLGFGIRFAPSASWRTICIERLTRALTVLPTMRATRARAFAAIGLAHACEASGRDDARLRAELQALGAGLRTQFERTATEEWTWFEEFLTYDNARLPEAVLRIGAALDDAELVEIGLRALRFYERTTIEHERFVPIGNAGWYYRGGARARYGQQPLEAAAMVDAELVAHSLTGDERHHRIAEIALDWFYGRNSRDALMVAGGGCCDGLEELGTNANMGAESTLAYLASAFAFAQRAGQVVRLAR